MGLIGKISKQAKSLALVIALLLLCTLNAKAIDRGNVSYLPLFVTIKTSWCHACKILDPIVEQLKTEYSGRVIFLELDATNDETIYSSQQVAQTYGVQEFFDTHRNAFPRTSIYCPGGLNPTQDLLGARQVEYYREMLDELISNGDTICSINGRPPTPVAQDRPNEPGQIEAIYGRADEPQNIVGRPLEFGGSGRPTELRFWTYGVPMPINLYIHSGALTLPTCDGDSQVLCYNGGSQKPLSNPDRPIFKPFDPNATRNEKGFDKIKIN